MATLDIYESNDPYSPLTSLFREDSFFVNDSNSLNFTELNNVVFSPIGFNSSNYSSSNSSSELIGNSGDAFMDMVSRNDDALSGSDTNSLPNVWETSSIVPTMNGIQNEMIQILAQPKALYRGRYPCEIDPKKKRAQRFIRAETNDQNLIYPTIKIPSWCDRNRQLYIRVTLVTITNENIPNCYIHPYTIDTPDENVIRDELNNSLYFRINENEYNTYKKSFRIVVMKKKYTDLRSYGALRLFNNGSFEYVNVNDPQDSRDAASLSTLSESRFIFTIAERHGKNIFPVVLCRTSVETQIMLDNASEARNLSPDSPNEPNTNQVKCIPQQGNWVGGDEVVIIMPHPIKRKVYTISFDFGEHGRLSVNEIIAIDTRTLLFRTPTCPIPPGDNNIKISIFIQDNRLKLPPIYFHYITPLSTIITLCSHCQGNPTNNNNKRRWEYDNAKSLISRMNQLSIQQTSNRSHSQISSDKIETIFDKYLTRLQEALEVFVRNNDPSQLFRQTRFLLSKFSENSPPLHDAIKHGHTDLSLSLIKQIINTPSLNQLIEDANENGETILLIAAKMNEWKIIECILKSRSDLVKHKDKNGNNLLHILASLDEDKGVETIKKVLELLSKELKMNLLEEQNKINEMPMDIAKSHCNIFSYKHLIDAKNV